MMEMKGTPSQKVIYAALAANLLIALSKFIAAFLTGSSSILSEGIHSLVDTGNELFLLYGMYRARQPADREFPFGHGKEIYFWSMIVALMIFALGSGLSIYEGVERLFNPRQLKYFSVNYAVIAVAAFFESFSWFVSFREFSKTKGEWGLFQGVRASKDPRIFVVLFEDSAALLGLAVAAAGNALVQLTGLHYPDGVASIMIGIILGGTAFLLARETKGLLIGESADAEVQAGIRRIAEESELVEHVNEVLTMHMGPEFILVNISLDFKSGTTSDDIEKAVELLDRRMKADFPRVKKIFIEAEAWKRKQ